MSISTLLHKDEYPFNRVPKVAFMFLTRGPLPLLPLWERFFRGHEKYFSIYVHTPRNYALNVSSESPFYGRQIPSKVCTWLYGFCFWFLIILVDSDNIV